MPIRILKKYLKHMDLFKAWVVKVIAGIPPSESFFHTLKTELIHHRRYQNREEAKQEIFEYIEVFYNRQRRHSTIGYQTPLGYEKASRKVA